MLDQCPSPPYWSHIDKSHLLRIIMHIYFLRGTYFSQRYEENDIIFSAKPPKRSNHPNKYLPGSTCFPCMINLQKNGIKFCFQTHHYWQFAKRPSFAQNSHRCSLIQLPLYCKGLEYGVITNYPLIRVSPNPQNLVDLNLLYYLKTYYSH